MLSNVPSCVSRRLFSLLIFKSMSEHLNNVQKLSIIYRSKFRNVIQYSWNIWSRPQRRIIRSEAALLTFRLIYSGRERRNRSRVKTGPCKDYVARASLEKGTTLARLPARLPLPHNSSYLRPTCRGFSAQIQPAVADTRAICSSEFLPRLDSSGLPLDRLNFELLGANRVTKVSRSTQSGTLCEAYYVSKIYA